VVLGTVLKALEISRLGPCLRLLKLELTENMLMQNAKEARAAAVHKLKLDRSNASALEKESRNEDISGTLIR
jgi:hypothetical protein